jgi:GNAT superfamily N-acetyltransferase
MVEIDGKAAGYAVLTVSYSMEHGGLRGFVDDLFVRPEARRRGLATALLTAIHGEAMDRGVRALVVETSLVESPARRLYAHAGFKDRGLQLLSQELAAPLHTVPAP